MSGRWFGPGPDQSGNCYCCSPKVEPPPEDPDCICANSEFEVAPEIAFNLLSGQYLLPYQGNTAPPWAGLTSQCNYWDVFPIAPCLIDVAPLPSTANEMGLQYASNIIGGNQHEAGVIFMDNGVPLGGLSGSSFRQTALLPGEGGSFECANGTEFRTPELVLENDCFDTHFQRRNPFFGQWEYFFTLDFNQPPDP